MGIKKTEFARKVDTNGRVIIPSDLRDELDIRPGDLLDFCIYEH
jgi:AbrB family looped-hinge helix DNA binding protein